MKRTFKNFDEYSEYYENREHKMNDVDVVENTVTVCADGEFECKNWKTAVRRFFKEINDNSLFDGWKECITECVENGIWKEKEEYNGEHVCGGWVWEVECIDEGLWYVSLTVSKEIEEESESAETVESVETKEEITMTKAEKIFETLTEDCETFIKEHADFENTLTFSHRYFDEYNACVRTYNAVLKLVEKRYKDIVRKIKLGVWTTEDAHLPVLVNDAVKRTVEDAKMMEQKFQKELKEIHATFEETEENDEVTTVESVEETTVSETETVEKIKEETTMAKRFYFTNENGDNIGNDHIGNIRGAKAAAKRLANEFNCEVCINDCETEDMLDFVYPDRKPETETVEETAEQETELNAEVAEVEAEQTAEPETFSKSKSESESEPTVDSNTVETYQGNINVLIVADIANTFEMITHTGYFDTS